MGATLGSTNNGTRNIIKRPSKHAAANGIWVVTISGVNLKTTERLDFDQTEIISGSIFFSRKLK